MTNNELAVLKVVDDYRAEYQLASATAILDRVELEAYYGVTVGDISLGTVRRILAKHFPKRKFGKAVLYQISEGE